MQHPPLFNQMTQMRESLKACDLELHRHRCHNVKEERFGHILLSNTNTAARWVYCMLGIPRWHLSFYCTFPHFSQHFQKQNQKKTIKGNHTDYIDTTSSSNLPPTQPTQIFAHDAVTYESTPTPDHKPFCFSVGSSRDIQWGSHVFDIDAFNPIRHL